MKFESYSRAYDALTECAREADQMNLPTVRAEIETARAQLYNTWNLVQSIERVSGPVGN